jgi:hypothetical protein
MRDPAKVLHHLVSIPPGVGKNGAIGLWPGNAMRCHQHQRSGLNSGANRGREDGSRIA